MPPLFSAKCSRLPLVSSVSVVLLFALNWLVLPGYMLGQSQPQPQATPDVQQQQNQQNTTPSAGGPEGDIGPIAVPKKKEEPTPKKEEATKPPKKDEADRK